LAKQINTLTGVRGIAAIWVVLLHGSNYVNLSSAFPSYLENFISKGWLGVDLFFILSGFVISYVHQSDFLSLKGEAVRRFIKLRVARIYPAHFIATIILLPVVIGAHVFSIYTIPSDGDNQFTLMKLFYSLLLINGWGIPGSIGWNVPSWSVGSEWFAYLCFPFIAYVYNKIRATWIHFLLILVIFSIMVILAVFLNDMQQYMLHEAYSLARITSEFLVGCSLYNIFKRLPDHNHYDLAAMVSCLLVITFASIGLSPFYDFLIIMGFAALLLSLSRSEGIVAGIFASQPLLYLGRISYSIYLAHATILMIFNQIFKRVAPAEMGEAAYCLVFYTFYIAGAIIAGHILYALVEKPARNYLRKKWAV
jgi:peptidoglycan/LPS O-acetylase OafA/YrhL